MTYEGEVVGKPSLGIREEQLVSLIKMVAFAARRVRRELREDVGENRLSELIVTKLIELQERLDVRYLEFHPEAQILDVGGGQNGVLGRIDIKVKYQHHFARHGAYFGIECKRITPKDRDQARYYVEGGVAKFADRRYSLGHPAGMMLAYLLQAPVEGVLDDIERRVLKAHPGASAFVHWEQTHWTERVVEGTIPRDDDPPLRLLHVFVPMWRLR